MLKTNLTPRLWLGVLVTIFIVVAIPLTLLAVRTQQNISPSAYGEQSGSGCSQAPVDVEFRKNTGENPDKPWKSGNSFNAKVGDMLEVNCFAKGGSALLSNGTIKGKVDGETIDLEDLSEYFDGTQVRGYEITQAGEYVFECKNNNGSCKNSDKFTVEAAALPSPTASASASPSPSPSPTGSPNPGCSSFAPSDLNRDCSSTIQDYDLFLRDFIDQQE